MIKDRSNGAATPNYPKPHVTQKQDNLRGLNDLHEENEQLREHFIYLIGTALEDKECRKIYAKGLIEIFDDCANLDEAKIKIKEYLDD